MGEENIEKRKRGKKEKGDFEQKDRQGNER